MNKKTLAILAGLIAAVLLCLNFDEGVFVFSFEAEASSDLSGMPDLSGGKFVKKNDKLYYYTADGKKVKAKVFRVNSYAYGASKKGVLYKNKKFRVGNFSYYANDKYHLVSNKWIKVASSYYYFGDDCKMVTNTIVKEYAVGKSGKRLDKITIESSNKTLYQYSEEGFVIVGHSHVKEMAKALEDSAKAKNVIFIYKGGAGYDWLKTTAGIILKKYFALYPNIKIVFELGGNDLINIKKYIRYYRKLMKENTNASIYLMDVLPVSDYYRKNSGQEINKRRQQFNKALKNAFPSAYIGGMDYLLTNGFETVDGRHYNYKTYRLLFQYILSKIK